MSALTFPDIQRSTPVTVPADSPQSCTFSSQSPKRPFPMLSGIQLIVLLLRIRSSLHRSHLDEPGLSCVIDQRSVTSPAVRIAVLKLRCGDTAGLSSSRSFNTSGDLPSWTEYIRPMGRLLRHLTFCIAQAARTEGHIFFRPWQSSSPNAGAIWTTPVPSVSVT